MLFVFACTPGPQGNQTPDTTAEKSMSYSSHGEKISPEEAVPVVKVSEMVATTGKLDQVKLEGKVEDVCQNKGCWMTMKLADGQDMRIKFKDYGFFVPKDCSGKTAIIEGKAFYDTIPVADLRHYAVDGGMSEEEAEKKYQEPEISVNFEATGVLIESEEEANSKE